MDVLVSNGNGVHAQLFRDEVDGVETILNLINDSVFGYATRGCNGSAKIERCNS